jgi:nicotinate-nucleotide pyrophosphorylase (carboxylating)
VVAGGDVFAKVFYSVDPGLRVERNLADGARAEVGAVLWKVEGAAHSILRAERTALNFVQRMSGIATLTRRYVDQIPEGAALRVVDTRKTTPGLRALERYAVRCGGGHNHRNDLGSAVLIKDNHIAAAGGVAQALERAHKAAAHLCAIEVEVDSLDQLKQALPFAPSVVMLDTFSLGDLKAAVKLAQGKVMLEASGGITIENVFAVAETGVDVISIGALTHSAMSLDVGLDVL